MQHSGCMNFNEFVTAAEECYKHELTWMAKKAKNGESIIEGAVEGGEKDDED